MQLKGINVVLNFDLKIVHCLFLKKKMAWKNDNKGEMFKFL